MNPLTEAIEALGLTSVWTYLALFLIASLAMIWRLEALQSHGLEGTALGTLVMPYCSGLGNLVFVSIVAAQKGPAGEVLTNCIVNNVTNLTLLLGLPALLWGLQLDSGKKGAKKSSRGGKRSATGGGAKAKGDAAANTDSTSQLSQLSLLLTLAAVLFFTGVTWALGQDGQLDASDGLVLVGIFFFWQCFQVYDVTKHNVQQRRSFGPLFYLDVFFVLLAAAGIYVSIDWLVAWLTAQKGGFVSVQNLGWLSGWLMVLPNALLAFYYAWRRRAEVAYASQVGDGHICIPLCLGLAALLQPLKVPEFFELGLGILAAAAILHLLCVLISRGLPRWTGWPLVAAYIWFVAAGIGG